MHVVAIRAVARSEICGVFSSRFHYIIVSNYPSTALAWCKERIKARGEDHGTGNTSLSTRTVIEGTVDHTIAFFISLICSKARIFLPTVAAANLEPLSGDYKKLRRTIKLEIKAFESVYA